LENEDMSITGGTVTFEQSRKLAEYENRKALVMFNVTDENGAEAEVGRALDLARDKVLEALGLVKPKDVAVAAPLAAPVTVPAALPAVPKKSHKRKVVADPTEVEETKPAISTGEERVDPTDVGDAADLTAAPRPIGDKDLTDALGDAMRRLAPTLGAAIARARAQQYLAKFVAFPKKSHDIPQEARQQFLDGLLELKP
jgi:hypothetical protein